LIKITPVPLLSDNYAYLLECGQEAVVVDPSEAEPLKKVLKERGLTLVAIWCTHHHWDHTGGVEGLPKVPVFGSRYDQEQGRIPRQSRGLEDGERFGLWGQSVEVLYVPGHTLGAIAYRLIGEPDALFTGDTLFLAGCGRLFEGTAPMLRVSLAKIRALAPETRLYPGHEYTAKNLRFAATVEPENPVRLKRQQELSACTVPGTLSEELESNPFLRWELLKAAGENDDSCFARIRMARDRF
jgi:hydroxyacylglutathione hydrolase